MAHQSGLTLLSLSKSCSSKAVLKVLQEIIARDGVREEIKTHHSSAFKSTVVEQFCEECGSKQNFGTPCVHTFVGKVERHLRTFQDFVQTYLIEDSNFERAISRSLYVMNFRVHKRLNRNPIGKIESISKLEFPKKDLLESVHDSSGRDFAENFYSKGELVEIVDGRSRGEEDLKVRLNSEGTVGKFIVLNCWNQRNQKSKFDFNPKRVIKESNGGKI